MLSYEHFTLNERNCLAEGIQKGESLRKIAKQLGKNVSSVSRELKRNRNKDGKYTPQIACNRYLFRRRQSVKPYRLLQTDGLMEYVIEKLKMFWSPETIVALWKKAHPGAKISPSTIYRWLKTERIPLCNRREVLRRRGKRKHQRTNDCKFTTIQPDHHISERSQVIEQRQRIGDWEGDTVVGQKQKSRLVTMVDRKTRFLVADYCQHKSAKAISDVILRMLKDMPVNSITLDNGSEFAGFRDIAKKLDTIVYFADPHAPWQRGSNENFNGALRFFFPKGTDFSLVTPLQLQAAVDLINNRPLKCLNWLTPKEAFFSKCCT